LNYLNTRLLPQQRQQPDFSPFVNNDTLYLSQPQESDEAIFRKWQKNNKKNNCSLQFGKHRSIILKTLEQQLRLLQRL